MNFRETYKKAVEIISSRTVDAQFDAMCLVEKVFGLDRTQYYLKADERVSDEKYDELINLAERRASGEPLQYILGQWDFMGRTFFVGKGVLIPRPETEMIVEAAIDYVKCREKPIIFDLCSGSGCIGISVAAEKPDSTVYVLEKSSEALVYLKKNIELHKAKNVFPIQGDIFTDFFKFSNLKPDLILSNPPYIESGTISSLQEEVLKEPVMALDGGDDGLDFYKAISSHWIPLLNESGAVIVECGENQGKKICDIFKKNECIKEASFYLDYCENERMVIAKIGS